MSANKIIVDQIVELDFQNVQASTHSKGDAFS